MMMKKCGPWMIAVLVVVGALNWGLLGAKFNLVNTFVRLLAHGGTRCLCVGWLGRFGHDRPHVWHV